MGVSWTWARGVWRRQLRSLIGLGVIAGLGVGGALVATEGARRADTAYGRLADKTLAFDAITSVDDELFGQMAALPEVEAAARFSYTPVAPEPLVAGVDAGAFAAMDEGFLTSVYRPAVLEGRAPMPGATDEVLINEAMAELSAIEPGQEVTLRSGFADAEVVALGTAKVVGIVRGQFDVGANAGNPSMLLPNALVEAHREQLTLLPEPPALIRLREDASLSDLVATVEGLAGHEVGFLSAESDADGINRSLQVQSVGYTALALVLAAATLLVVTQGIARELRSSLGADLRTLVAMGAAPRLRYALAAAVAVPVVATAAVLTVVVAILGSSLVPTGLAGDIELERGIRLDGPVVVVGSIGVVLVLVALTVVVAWPLHVDPTSRSVPPTRMSRILGTLPLRARLGAELALAPRRAPAGVAARSALVATVFATGAVLGVAVFSSSLDRLLDPDHVDLAGWDFDIALIGEEGEDPVAFDDALQTAVRDHPPDALNRVHVVNLVAAGEPLEVFAFEPSDTPVHPTMRAGRPPAADDEAALGRDTADQLDVAIGDHVDLAGPSGSRSVRVVGIAAFPEIGNNGDIGNGASVMAGLATDLGAEPLGSGVLLRYDGELDAATLETLEGVGEAVEPFLGPRVQRLEQVGGTPRVLAFLLALIGAAAIGHGLIRATLDRGRDLAVLRAVGMRPRDVRAVIASHAAVTSLVGASIGVIVGLIVGPWTWQRVADGVAAVPSTAIPVSLYIAAVPATTALALLTSVWPGWRASRRSVVDALAASDALA